MKAKKRQMFCASAEFTRRVYSTVALLVCAVLLLAGCGAKSGSTLAPGQAVVITAQPLSQSVPISETATFTATATGTAPLNYQWSEDGAEIAGATSASYATPPVALGGSGSTLVGSFQVTVSNASSSAISNSATLTAGPRSPKPGDLRYLLFEQVDVPGLNPIEVTRVAFDRLSFGNAIGTPLYLGSTFDCVVSGVCSWGITAFGLPSPMTGLTMWYNGGNYSNFSSDMQSIVASNVVFTSLDIETAESNYGVSWVATAQTGAFDYRLEPIPFGANLQAQIQATASQDGAESRVVTAVSFDDQLGQADLISYGWQGDTTTVYETQAIVAAPANVVSAATTLAGDGYVISAFGGNDIDGYMLIGMRVQGDSLPRPIAVNAASGFIPAKNPDSAYFTNVVLIDEAGEGGFLTSVAEQ